LLAEWETIGSSLDGIVKESRHGTR
jgi:hypothetical protein